MQALRCSGHPAVTAHAVSRRISAAPFNKGSLQVVVMLSASHVLQNSPQFTVQGVEVWTPRGPILGANEGKKVPLQPLLSCLGFVGSSWFLLEDPFLTSEEGCVNTFTAIVDLSRFYNSCLKSPASTSVNLIFQSRSFSLNQLTWRETCPAASVYLADVIFIHSIAYYAYIAI